MNEKFYKPEVGVKESELTPESPERIRATRAALEKLVTVAAQDFAADFSSFRNIEEWKVSPPAQGESDFYERWVVKKADPSLRTIALRKFVGEEMEEAYHLYVSFSVGDSDDPDLSKPIILTIESPIDLAPYSLSIMEAVAKTGIQPDALRIQDYSYTKDGKTVEVTTEDFTRLHSYRSIQSRQPYRHQASKEELDAILPLLADSDILTSRDVQKPKEATARVKVSELAPQVSEFKT